RGVLTELLREDPRLAVRLAEQLEFQPAFVRSVAEDVRQAAKASGQAWTDLVKFGLPGPEKRERDGEYVARIGLLLLGNPPLLARVVDRLGSAVPFTTVLARELEEIAAARLARDPAAPVPPPPATADPYRSAEEMNLLGLALSGGGIRSATFNLGVIQGLASLGLLRRFDLLSTVSGGGYIGGWLAGWIKRSPGGIDAVEGSLKAGESWPVTFLRQYSNYLTPRPGFLSADTWTLVTTWVRNTLLNQTVLVLFLAAALLVPHIVYGAQVLWGSQLDPRTWLLLAAILLVIVSIRTGRQLRDYDRDLANTGPRWSSQTQVQRRIVLLALLSGIFASSFLTATVYRSGPGSRLQQLIFWSFFAVFVIGLALTQWIGGFGRCFPRRTRWHRLGIGLLLVLVAGVCAALGAAVIWAHIGLFTSRWFVRLTGGTWGILIFGPALLMQSYALAVTLQQGLLGRQFPDERREWWSRAGAWVLIYSFGWAIFSAVVMLVPFWFLYGASQLPLDWDLAKKALTALWAAITAGGVMAAKADSTGNAGGAEPARSRWIRWLPFVAPYVFILGLAVMLSLGVFLLLTRVLYPSIFGPEVKLHAANFGQYWCLMYGGTPCGAFTRHWPDLPRPLLALVLAAAAGAVALLLAWRVDVNDFSMHHFYKNRLVRCYLGGTRGRTARQPNPFTGFDPDDDLLLARMHLATRRSRTANPEEAYDGPYHIVNTALNLVTGENLAWQERKAASFVFTPHFSGFEVNEEPGAGPGSDDVASDGYRPTDRYGYPPTGEPGLEKIGGIHLGTALAISGAAANPNMGYHSSAAAAFLMTMFNVRLGWWMGNPRHRVTHAFSSPRILGLAYLLNELTGNSDDRSRYVNLSDGGHFDNLGVYELVRRRCRWIVVCDAEQDADIAFGGLGNAIRKCRADFGVDIDVRPLGIRALGGDGSRAVHCAVGTIRYGSGGPGTLVYLKSSLTGDEPTDVLEYRRRQPGFPHQSTGDQWFDESQFESYRELGYHIATRVLGPAPGRTAWDPAAFFQNLATRWHPPSAAVERHFTRHVEAYDALMERMRRSTVPASLDAALYPALGATPPPFPELAALLGAPAAQPSAAEERTAFYLCNSLILLMERVFLDLDLEGERDHPHNQGWVTLFQQWAAHPQFRAAWTATSSGYGMRFQRFVREVVGLT
ncbi:MAG TPA: patatin-like phospholipase family protein, partial [Gemmatimonadales bacterium]|nr:patatin-like phospholipase family protein [Gemmatimonadales bacterium]